MGHIKIIGNSHIFSILSWQKTFSSRLESWFLPPWSQLPPMPDSDKWRYAAQWMSNITSVLQKLCSWIFEKKKQLQSSIHHFLSDLMFHTQRIVVSQDTPSPFLETKKLVPTWSVWTRSGWVLATSSSPKSQQLAEKSHNQCLSGSLPVGKEWFSEFWQNKIQAKHSHQLILWFSFKKTQQFAMKQIHTKSHTSSESKERKKHPDL